MTTQLRVDGADISRWQSGELDLSLFRGSAPRFLYHKATEGTTVVDPKYAQRRAEAKAANVPFGAYHFARPEKPSDAVAEARAFIAVAKPVPGDLIPALDLEVTGALNMAELKTWAQAFSAEVLRLTGVLPVLYCPWDFKLPNVRWVPRYNDTNTPPRIPWDIWQFSNGEFGVPNKVAGLGNVDLNHFADGTRLANIRIPFPPDGKDEPGEKARTGWFRLVTQNVQALPLMPQREVVEDVQLTARQAGIVGWQEIGPDRYEQAIKDLPDDWSTFFGKEPNGDVPISFRNAFWKRIDSGVELLHEPKAKVQPWRKITWIILEHRNLGVRIVVTNRHYVAGKDNKKHSLASRIMRKAIWLLGRRRDRRLLAKFVDQGYPVIAFGDFNDRSKSLGTKIRNRVIRYLNPDSSIDKIAIINGDDWVFEVDDRDGELLNGRNSDHQGRRGKVRLRRR